MDAGCGTGHHLAQTRKQFCRVAGVDCHGLGIDISKAAIGFASRRLQNSAFAVTDIWDDWPARTASVDLLISIFAPKNFPEMARALRPGGLLALVYPGPTHLVELRRELSMLEILPRKSGRYLEAARKHFGQVTGEHHGRRSLLTADEVLDLILMGPSARKAADKAMSVGKSIMEVTFDVEILFARFPRAASSDRLRSVAGRDAADRGSRRADAGGAWVHIDTRR